VQSAPVEFKLRELVQLLLSSSNARSQFIVGWYRSST
jgi:hypothetical protein